MDKSMISTIKTVGAAVEAVLGKTATTDQIVATIEAIEVLVGGNKVVDVVERKTFVTQQPVPASTTAVKPKAKPKARAKKRYVNWRQYKPWFDVMLDGQPHVLTFHELSTSIPPLAGANNHRIHKVIWTVARSRGLKASIEFDNKLSLVRIKATK